MRPTKDTAPAGGSMRSGGERATLHPVSKKRERTVRREAMRQSDKITEARTKLAALEPGGTSSRPEIVDSASQIDGRAAGLGCLRCQSQLKVSEHRAITDPRVGSVREVELACPRCGARRVHYYQVRTLQ